MALITKVYWSVATTIIFSKANFEILENHYFNYLLNPAHILADEKLYI